MLLHSPGEESLLYSLRMACSPEVSGLGAGAWALTDWDTPLLVSRSAIIPSGLRNAPSSLESSLIVQVEISSQPREHASVQGAGEKGRLLCPCVPLGLDNIPPVTPTTRIQASTKGIMQRQLCWDAASSTTSVQIQTPVSPVVVAAGSRGVVVERDNISPAHPGNKRKGSALRQGMGAAIQEKEEGGVTHCKDPLLTANKKRGPLTYHK